MQMQRMYPDGFNSLLTAADSRQEQLVTNHSAQQQHDPQQLGSCFFFKRFSSGFNDGAFSSTATFESE